MEPSMDAFSILIRFESFCFFCFFLIKEYGILQHRIKNCAV